MRADQTEHTHTRTHRIIAVVEHLSEMKHVLLVRGTLASIGSERG